MIELYRYFPIKNRRARRLFVLLDDLYRKIKYRNRPSSTLEVHNINHRRR